jgi:hypothetical protein
MEFRACLRIVCSLSVDCLPGANRSVAVPAGKPQLVATIDKLHPTAAIDYHLIGLAPGDLPAVTARTAAVNLYQVDLNER